MTTDYCRSHQNVYDFRLMSTCFCFENTILDPVRRISFVGIIMEPKTIHPPNKKNSNARGDYTSHAIHTVLMTMTSYYLN